MARANLVVNGLSFYKPKFGFSGPVEPVPVPILTNNTYAIYAGDPVAWASTGYADQAAAGTAASFIVKSVLQYRNASGVLVRNGRSIPAATTFTADTERSLVLGWPVESCLFLAQADEGTTITTVAAARAIIGENVDLVKGTVDDGLGLSGFALDISGHATTNTLTWRLYDILESPGNDSSLTRATYIVYANLMTNKGGTVSATGV